jgi:hypothetical protein
MPGGSSPCSPGRLICLCHLMAQDLAALFGGLDTTLRVAS